MAEGNFEKARRAHLPSLARSMGIYIRNQGRSFGSNDCPSCGKAESHESNRVNIFLAENGEWRWKCFACGHPASSAIDYMALMCNVTHREAVDLILGNSTICAPVSKEQVAVQKKEVEERNEKLVGALRKILKNSGKVVAVDYLVSRGIPKELAEMAADKGIVRSLQDNPETVKSFLVEHVGKKLLQESGLWKHDKKMPSISFKPIIFPTGPEGAEFRLNRPPRDNETKSMRVGKLDKPIWWGSKTNHDILIVEGGIDLLSVVAMGWQGCVMGALGTNGWKEEWFPRLKKKYPDARFVLGFDNDKPGRDANKKVAELLDGLNYPYSTIVPFGDVKDWNDSLIQGERF